MAVDGAQGPKCSSLARIAREAQNSRVSVDRFVWKPAAGFSALRGFSIDGRPTAHWTNCWNSKHAKRLVEFLADPRSRVAQSLGSEWRESPYRNPEATCFATAIHFGQKA